MSRQQGALPAVDLEYTIDRNEVGARRDSTFYYRRMDQAVLREAVRDHRASGAPLWRLLDVACGTGDLAARLRKQGWEAWGLDASAEMLGLGRWQGFDQQVAMVRGIAEALPFPDSSFDRVVCKGSLDHFAEPASFMAEAARVLRPGGRLVIALANYDSLSCHLGRAASAARRALGMRRSSHRPYWEQPPDHTVRGNLSYVRALGAGRFDIETCYGLSLLWLFPPWGRLLDRLPPRLAWATWTALDRIAYRLPAAADMIVSVWRPRPAAGERPP